MRFPVINLGEASLGQTAEQIAAKSRECARLDAFFKDCKKAGAPIWPVKSCETYRQQALKCQAELRAMINAAARQNRERTSQPAYPEFGTAPFARMEPGTGGSQSYPIARTGPPTLQPSMPYLKPEFNLPGPMTVLPEERPSVATEGLPTSGPEMPRPPQQLVPPIQTGDTTSGMMECLPPNIRGPYGECLPGTSTGYQGGGGYGGLVSAAMNLGPSGTAAGISLMGRYQVKPLMRGRF